MAGFKRISVDGFGSTMFDANVASLEKMGVEVLGLGVVSGLALSAGTGLALIWSAGVLCGRKVQAILTGTDDVPDDQTSYVWMSDDGAVTFSVSATHPGGNIVCLGKVVAASGAITSVTTDNRMDCWGWSDPYTLSIGGGLLKIDLKNQVVSVKELQGSGGPIGRGFADITGAKTDADYTLSATEYVKATIRLGWTGWTAGHNVIVPAVTGAIFNVINATGQAATIKAATGTGVAIANGKAAQVVFDGTNIVRLTADA